jgi:hypothetical protein
LISEIRLSIWRMRSLRSDDVMAALVTALSIRLLDG